MKTNEKTKENKQELEDIAEIRKLMERSSRFISLSGISGIFVGSMALLGVAIAFLFLKYDDRYFRIATYFGEDMYVQAPGTMMQIILLGAAVLVVSVVGGVFFTRRKALRHDLPAWNRAAARMLGHMLFPLATGGIFVLILVYHKLFFLIAPVTLIFYGLGLINGSKFTLPELKGLGMAEVALGLIAAFFVGYGLILWAIGFGFLHIFYGVFMYRRYER